MNIRTAFLFIIMQAIFQGVIYAGDISIDLDDGNRIILYEDKTWSFENRYASKPAHTMTLDVSDGRTVILQPDGSWDYETTRGGKATRARPMITRLSGTGMAKRGNVMESIDSARAEAVRRVVRSFHQTIGDTQPPDSVLIPCIDILATDSLAERSIDKDNTAKVKITFTGSHIRDLFDCIGW